VGNYSRRAPALLFDRVSISAKAGARLSPRMLLLPPHAHVGRYILKLFPTCQTRLARLSSLATACTWALLANLLSQFIRDLHTALILIFRYFSGFHVLHLQTRTASKLISDIFTLVVPTTTLRSREPFQRSCSLLITVISGIFFSRLSQYCQKLTKARRELLPHPPKSPPVVSVILLLLPFLLLRQIDCRSTDLC
jgi:hypothetical protein